jgi:hypothetical protein
MPVNDGMKTYLKEEVVYPILMRYPRNCLESLSTIIKITLFCEVIPCSLVDRYKGFKEAGYLSSSALKMEPKC